MHHYIMATRNSRNQTTHFESLGVVILIPMVSNAEITNTRKIMYPLGGNAIFMNFITSR